MVAIIGVAHYTQRYRRQLYVKRYGVDKSPLGAFKVTRQIKQVPKTQAPKERSWTIVKKTGPCSYCTASSLRIQLEMIFCMAYETIKKTTFIEENDMNSYILPLNENPSLTTCIHYAYPCAIIESKELARVYIKRYNKENWNDVVTGELLIEATNDNITINGEGDDSNVVLWKKNQNDDELLLKIEYLKHTDQTLIRMFIKI